MEDLGEAILIEGLYQQAHIEGLYDEETRSVLEREQFRSFFLACYWEASEEDDE